MIEHLDDGQLQALLDEELGEVDTGSAKAHLRSCAECRARLDEARDANHRLSTALSLLDRSRPELRPSVIRPPSTVRPGGWRRLGMARAAAMLLTVAAAASATVPGSPLRELITRGLRGPQEVATLERTADSVPMVAATEALAETSIGVELEDGRFTVILTETAPAVRIRASLIDGSEGAVYATGDAVSARFGTSPGTITVSGVAAGELRVEIPSAAEDAAIRVDGRTYLTKVGDQLRLAGSPGDSMRAEVFFEVRP